MGDREKPNVLRILTQMHTDRKEFSPACNQRRIRLSPPPMAESRPFVPIVHHAASPRRHFVLVGRLASSTERFSLDDLPTSGGRMDIIARCIRAAFLLANGIRRNTIMNVVLLGGERAPTTLRIDGSAARFLRPDERRLAGHIRHALGVVAPSDDFEVVAPGMERGRVGLREALPPPWPHPVYVLDPQGTDLRSFDLCGEATFVIGDHIGLSLEEVSWLADHGAVRASLGPVEVHAEDAIAIVHNEIDRQCHVAEGGKPVDAGERPR